MATQTNNSNRGTKDNWLKGVLMQTKVKDTLIPILETHYKEQTKQWTNTEDDHLQHLLDFGAKGEVKRTKEKEPAWEINCIDCRPILGEIEKSHNKPPRLMWNNNKKDDKCSNDFRLARMYMPRTSKGSKTYIDLDALPIFEIIKNDKSFDVRNEDIKYLILFRNRLMHSCDNCITEDELEDAFDNMKKLLESDKFKDLPECISACEELDKLKAKSMICEIDESNENWKLAIRIQEYANKDAGIETQSHEAMNIVLHNLEEKLKNEQCQRITAQKQLSSVSGHIQNYNEKLSKVEGELSHLKNLLKINEDKLEHEKLSKASEYEYYVKEKEKLQKEMESKESAHKNLDAELIKVKKEIEKMEQPKGIAERVLAGSVTGLGVGAICGPIGAAAGGAAGGAVGGLSCVWDNLLSWKKSG